MVYKIGNITDLATIPITDGKTFELLYHYARVLTSEYGQERSVTESDGGYILYCPPNTKAEDIKAFFDYTKHTVELVERFGSLCAAMYTLHNEYVVTILMSTKDLPIELIEELEDR